MPASKKYSSNGFAWPIIGHLWPHMTLCFLIKLRVILDYPFGDLFYIGSSPITLCVSLTASRTPTTTQRRLYLIYAQKSPLQLVISSQSLLLVPFSPSPNVKSNHQTKKRARIHDHYHLTGKLGFLGQGVRIQKGIIYIKSVAKRKVSAQKAKIRAQKLSRFIIMRKNVTQIEFDFLTI